MDPVKVPWELKGGSIYTKELVSMRSLFPGNKKTYKIPVAIAFNVGEIVGAHIVEAHNAHLRNQVTQIIGPWWDSLPKTDLSGIPGLGGQM